MPAVSKANRDAVVVDVLISKRFSKKGRYFCREFYNSKYRIGEITYELNLDKMLDAIRNNQEEIRGLISALKIEFGEGHHDFELAGLIRELDKVYSGLKNQGKFFEKLVPKSSNIFQGI